MSDEKEKLRKEQYRGMDDSMVGHEIEGQLSTISWLYNQPDRGFPSLIGLYVTNLHHYGIFFGEEKIPILKKKYRLNGETGHS
jgi:hypothetical protein